MNDTLSIPVVTAATQSYLDTLIPCLRRIDSALTYAGVKRSVIIVATDKPSVPKVKKMLERFEGRYETAVVAVTMDESGEKYQKARQLLIANLQSIGFDEARKHNPDYLWSVESDVLVPHNALTCSLDMLRFDSGYYDVAFVTYPSQGGGGFLGGHGSYLKNIEDDVLMEEREIPDELKKLHEEATNALQSEPDQSKHPALVEALKSVNKRIETECPPTGNIFQLNSKKWRRRGWLDMAYPAIGRGAVVPTDWTGLGCTLMSRKALHLAHFDGYDGGGTQDLFLNWRRWKPEGMEFCVITHCTCDHIIGGGVPGKKVHMMTGHEPDGDFRGHLRRIGRAFYKFDGHDSYDPANDGVLTTPQKPTKPTP